MPKIARFSLLCAVAFLVLAVGSLTVFAQVYRGKFYPGSVVNGLKLSGQSYQQGLASVQQQEAAVADQVVTIDIPDVTKARDPHTNQFPYLAIITSPARLGVHFYTEQAVETVWRQDHTSKLASWMQTSVPALFHPQTVQVAYSIDPKGISTFVHTEVVPKIGTPIPAKLVVTGDLVSISQPQPGLVLDENALTEQLRHALADLSDGDQIALRAPVSQADSSTTSAMLEPLKSQLDVIGNVHVSLAASGVYLQPTRAQLLSFYQVVQAQDKALSLVLNQSTLSQYLAKTASLDQVASLSSAMATLGTLAASTTNQTPVRLAVALTVKPSSVRAVTAGQYTLGRHPGKYIEVNLAEQKLYRINGNTLEKVYLISSGKSSTPTPTGEFTLNGHNKRAFSYLYGLYMPYWINFLDGEYGLHELPEWPNGYKEGVNHLGVPVSDGCVRLGIGDAEEIYNWVPDGTPIYIH